MNDVYSVLVKVSAIIKMFKLPSLSQPTFKISPIFDKLLATFNFEDADGLIEIGECIIWFQWMYCTWHSCSKESVICGAPGSLNLCNPGAPSVTF